MLGACVKVDISSTLSPLPKLILEVENLGQNVIMHLATLSYPQLDDFIANSMNLSKKVLRAMHPSMWRLCCVYPKDIFVIEPNIHTCSVNSLQMLLSCIKR